VCSLWQSTRKSRARAGKRPKGYACTVRAARGRGRRESTRQAQHSLSKKWKRACCTHGEERAVPAQDRARMRECIMKKRRFLRTHFQCILGAWKKSASLFEDGQKPRFVSFHLCFCFPSCLASYKRSGLAKLAQGKVSSRISRVEKSFSRFQI
jgi:hypothetical protein